jgi:hypothetical protein
MEIMASAVWLSRFILGCILDFGFSIIIIKQLTDY